MILCVAPNANIENTWVVPGFRLGGVFRVQREVQLASGKGINVARGIRTLGRQALCMGFVGGHLGRLLVELAEREGLQGVWTWIQGENRQSIIISDPQAEGADATQISGQGPTVDGGDWQRLQADVLRQAQAAEWVCFSGSLPPGTPLEIFTETIAILEKANRPVWVDSSGDSLKAALLASPSGVKINALEAGEVAGFPVDDLPGAVKAARAFLEKGVRTVVLTMGKKGALLVTPHAGWFAQAAQLPRLTSSVGSGDVFLAGLLVGLVEGLGLPGALRQATAAGGANAQALGGGVFSLEDFQRALGTVSVHPLDLSASQ